MKHSVLAVVSIVLLGIALGKSARADEWDKKTILTISETFQVPNKVLPPGQYVMKLLDSPSDRHIVQIFSGDGMHLETTILAIPNYRLQPTGKTVVSFWETPPGQPKALRAWFYPGDNFGQEFAYPKSAAVQIAAVSYTSVPTTEAQQPSEMATAPVSTTTPEVKPEEKVEVAQSTPPPAPPQAESRSTPAPAPAPESLPKTASPYPLVGLAGLLALAIFVDLRAVRTS
jgi:hypothetical protein